MALRDQNRLRWLTRPQSSSWPSVVTEALDVNTDPGYFRGMGPGIAPGSNPGLMSSCTLGGSTGNQINMATEA